jgi:hypothetical protein
MPTLKKLFKFPILSIVLVGYMSSEGILSILLPELIEDVEELMPAILPPEEGLEHGSEAED